MAEKKRQGNFSETPNSMMLRRTLWLALVCGILAFLVLALRLFKLQIIDHDFYEGKAISQQVRDKTVTAKRGTIYDTNKKILAMSASVDNVFISPKEIEMYKEDPAFIADGLSKILGVDYSTILEKTRNTKSEYQTIAKKVEPEVSDLVRKFKNDNELKSIHLEEGSKRYYPYGSLASHVVGFVGSENSGLAGVELTHNSELTGIDGRVVRAKNAAGTDMLFTSFEDYYDAQDGKDTVLTIDSKIQHYVEKHLAQAARDFDVKHGAAAIAMDVKTGAILSMVSLGNFDLNKYQEVSEAAMTEINATENKEEKSKLLSEAQQLQWRNKAISDTYEPGSTFKIITLSMALNEGVISPTDTFYCNGSVKVPGDTKARKCWKTIGHGSQTLTQALQHSCNVAFIDIGQKMGAESFYKYCEAFGLFNSSSNPEARLSGRTGIDLGGESDSIWWSHNVFCDPQNKSQLAAASFGQTFNITPLQLITAVSACTNGGYLMKPYVVKETLNSDGTSASKTEPTVVRQVISEKTSKTVCEMLEKVVGDKVEGTGKNAAVAGYRIGGKTGTSEKTVKDAKGEAKEYIVSFLGVAPMDDPQIAILVLLDTPNSATGFISGGQMCAPTVGKMFSDILPCLGMEPNYTTEEEKLVDKSVPNLNGMTQDEAAAKLGENGFIYRVIGTSGTVTAQIPAANSIVAAGSQIIIYCGAEPSAQKETMPNITGMTYSMARQNLGTYALYLKASGPITNPAAIVVTKQSVPAGTPLDHGTVVEVAVSNNSDLGIY
ncbi:MAG: penicillin-binding transpeptidase domain-containing protein [Oscillospiraceae bacterium]